jgi:hypothetical protein
MAIRAESYGKIFKYGEMQRENIACIEGKYDKIIKRKHLFGKR